MQTKKTMKLRPLIIDDEAKEKIKKLIAYAEQHPYTMDDLLDIYNKQKEPPGDNKEFTIYLQVGFRVVFSIEEQNQGLFKHLSVSVDHKEKDTFPSIQAVRVIAKLMGFKREVKDCIVRLEDLGDRGAINVFEAI